MLLVLPLTFQLHSEIKEIGWILHQLGSLLNCAIVLEMHNISRKVFMVVLLKFKLHSEIKEISWITQVVYLVFSIVIMIVM